jgi:TPR repeat protein
MLDPQAYSPRRQFLETLAPEWGGSLKQMAAAVEFWKSSMDGEPMERLIQVVENRIWQIALQPAADLVEKKRYREAIELYNRAIAQAPVVRAYTMRGHSYAQLGQYDKALEDYNRSLELDPDSICCSGTRAGRGEIYLKLGAVDKALPDLMRAATDDDNAWAARELAMMYAFGKYGVKPDYSEARRWCERSAKEGDGLSMYCMGSLYYSGLGVERNSAQAEKWLKGAAERDIADAQADLGFFYMQGDGGAVSVPQGLYWWLRAAAHGNMRAISQVGSIALALGFLLILAGIWYSRYKKKTKRVQNQQ